MKKLIISIFVLVLVVSASATINFSYDINNVEYSAGSGYNSAILVIDFDLDHYVVFKYLWEETESVTALDALQALDTTGDLAVTGTSYIHELAYPGMTKFDYEAAGDTTDWKAWILWLSNDNDSWVTSGAGASATYLADGDLNGWVWSNGLWPPRGPGQEPTNVVPEPASLLLLGLGAFALRKKTKR